MTETVQWIDPYGTVTTLDVQWSVSGRYLPKVEFESDQVPGQAGEYFRFVRHAVREFSLPFDVQGTSESDLRTQVRAMVANLDPTRGEGRIRVTSPIGDQREIMCRVSSGLDLVESLGEASGPTWQRFPLTFIAHDPYWYDPSVTVTEFVSELNVAKFFPFFPLKLTASELAVDSFINNTGELDTWPMWRITGPGSVIVLRNLSTGKMMNFGSLALGDGQFFDIDTRPGKKTVTLDDGTNLFPYLSSDSSLWPLLRGFNSVRLEMGGIDATRSGLRLSYYRRYLSP